MEIRICGYLAASYLLENAPSQWDALVILDSRATASEFVQSHSRRHLYLRFDDIERPTKGGQLVTADQLAQGLEFALGSQRLLVACRAGQSRSAALAYLAACRQQGVSEALKLLDPRRHIPNPLVVSLGAQLLDLPEALDTFRRWQEDHRHVDRSAHFDELEREFDELLRRGAKNHIIADG